tara:strand:- start:38 stop:859 length:822 start_codon:yes stop_codon:yes gene_type:complete
MKTPYIYFGTKGYYYESDASGDQYIAGDSATSLTLPVAGMVPVDHTRNLSNTSTSTDAYRIVVKCGTAADNTRGENFTTDFVTGALFSVQGSQAAVKYAEVGDVTELNADSWGVASSGQITIANYATDNDHGYLLANNDKIWVEQVARHDAAGNGPAASNLSNMVAYPMYNFRGANPVAYAGEHYDGTALDQTDLHFAKADGTGEDDIIRLIHNAGKYPDIVKTIEAIANCGVYNRAITFYDLDINGAETFAGGPSLSGHNDLGIKGCWRTTA